MTVQAFLDRCCKRKFTLDTLDIRKLMKIQDHRIFRKVLSDCNHPIYNLLPEIKDTNYNLRRDTVVKPLVRTTRFMNVFSNRLIFRYYSRTSRKRTPPGPRVSVHLREVSAYGRVRKKLH